MTLSLITSFTALVVGIGSGLLIRTLFLTGRDRSGTRHRARGPVTFAASVSVVLLLVLGSVLVAAGMGAVELDLYAGLGFFAGLLVGVVSVNIIFRQAVAGNITISRRSVVDVFPPTQQHGLAGAIDLEPVDATQLQVLKGRYILWVDDQGLVGTEGVERQFQQLGVHLTVVRNTEDAQSAIQQQKPDAVISDIGRGDDHDAGIRMAEGFRASGLFRGPYFFYAGDLGHGRIGRAAQIGAVIFTEPKALIAEVKETLQIKGQPSDPTS
ncbi:MAG: hypothetical protein GTN78_03615 [Gemmatimonadales bacterium]|nr:hypothetical protein [Gemmatimonadales bacterium]NIQ99273.1 hypothetical protein [Gemmatimonadales bacterium]